jgi:hypothetical protein
VILLLLAAVIVLLLVSTTVFPGAIDSFPNPTQYDQQNVDTDPNLQHWKQHENANDAIEAIETALIGTGAGTFRILNGKAYFKNPLGGATPWHELVPVINEDGNLTFDISQTGVA